MTMEADMTKKTDARPPIRDMSKYTSPRMQKGVRYLDGSEKETFRARMQKVFGKIKLRVAH